MAAFLVVLVAYSLVVMQLFAFGESIGRSMVQGDELPMVTLQTGEYMKDLRGKYNIGDSEMLAAELDAVKGLPGRGG